MGFHHVAIAVRDIDKSHRFYTEAMGFELVKAVVAPTENEGGWAKHLFYDTGGQGLLALWDLHDAALDGFDPAISTGLGLPAFVNHLAFRAEDTADLDHRKQRWLDNGHDVVQIDHEFCVSIYANDPNGILVEWCCDSRPLTPAERDEALARLADPAPPLDPPPSMEVFRAPHPDAEPVPETVPAT
jgi:catechol 2,3-dioxygenase-like lactoylglutathione lyase family enzyme